ncbi:MAG: GGDEF domain-containing protein [Polyangiaceae bacterium]
MTSPSCVRGTAEGVDSADDEAFAASTPAEIVFAESVTDLPLFRRVDLGRSGRLLRRCGVVELGRGEVLLEKDRSNDVLYVVLSGSLSVRLESEDGDEVARVVPGQTVGEMSVIDDSPTSAFVVGAEPSRLLAIDEGTFWEFVRSSDEFSTNLLFLLAGRIRKSNGSLTEVSRQKVHFERASLVDPLTGLHNRRWLGEKLPRLLRRHEFTSEPVSVVAIDIDHFKRVNDTFGHAAGDRVLERVAILLRDNLRPTDLVARWGGEEFVAVLPGTPGEGALVAADRVRLAVANSPFEMEGHAFDWHVTLSMGVADTKAGCDADAILAAADAALYQAKRRGRNRVCASGGNPDET